MKTIVYQSFRTQNVPDWINICMNSVKHWAKVNKFDYLFIDDKLFEYSPEWYRKKVHDQIHLVSDLSRLVLAKKIISEGYDRTIWIDADVMIFSFEKFILPLDEEYAFCREIWLQPVSRNKLGFSQNVNNAVMIFSKKSSFLDFYIHACKEIVKHNVNLSHTSVGTKFLTNLNSQFPIAKIKNVGLFSPFVNYAINMNIEHIIKFYMENFGHKIYAVNLCTTFLNMNYCGINLTDEDYTSVISKLLETKGDIINKYINPTVPAQI